MRRSLDEAMAAMAGRLVVAGGDAGGVRAGDATWDGATFDSRELKGGELFFALPGEQTDGHRFVAAALEAGAAAAVVHHDADALAADWDQDLPAGGRLLVVEDTYAALHDLVRHLRDRSLPPRIAAITGSVGKTTTKELLAAILGRRHRVARNQGNLNNLYGFPLSVLRLPDDVEWMVAEMGMSSPGELAELTRLGRPDVVVEIAVRPVHMEFFDSLRGIAEAKAELLEGVRPDGFAVANAGDPEVVRFVLRWQEARRRQGLSDRVVWYATGEAAEGADGAAAPEPHLVATDVAPAGRGEPGSRFTLRVRGLPGAADARREMHLALHGAYNVDNALAAAACALALGATLDDVEAALAQARPPSGRGIVHRLEGGTAVVDDTYNSNPDALDRALQAVADLAGEGRRWAVLGDMLELGPEAPRYHREAGERAARLGFSPVAGVGDLSRDLAAAAGDAGAEAPWFGTADEAAAWAVDALQPGDAVLVKGSRGVGLDVVVERLVEAGGDPASRNPGEGKEA